MEIEGLKILINVKTWWVSMLQPLKHFLVEYKLTSMIEVSQDNPLVVQARLNYDILCDFYTLFQPW